MLVVMIALLAGFTRVVEMALLLLPSLSLFLTR